MGGPSTLSEIRPFLFRLFSDRELINFGVPPFLQKPLAFLISSFRALKVRKQYEAIGGGSPTVRQSLEQSRLVEAFTGVKTFAGMLYSDPLLGKVSEEVRGFSPDRVSVITLYPQYSQATVGACIREVKRFLGDLDLRFVRSWCRNRKYINWVRKLILREMESLSSPHILFSAHSLPKYMVDGGDPYVKEVEDTVRLVMEGIEAPYSISYQSKVGPIEWLSPSTESKIVELSEKGVRELVVFPISFVSEHIETLYEIDVEYRRLAFERGMEEFRRVKVEPFDDDLIAAISEEALRVLRGNNG